MSQARCVVLVVGVAKPCNVIIHDDKAAYCCKIDRGKAKESRMFTPATLCTSLLVIVMSMG
jgi:hypothetical protein